MLQKKRMVITGPGCSPGCYDFWAALQFGKYVGFSLSFLNNHNNSGFVIQDLSIYVN